MDNYIKGKNVEEPIEKNNIKIPDLPPNYLWFLVKGGSKIRNMVGEALKSFEIAESIVWTGCGPSVNKAISCAEIFKKEIDCNLHQTTKICYRNVEEYWDPVYAEMDQIIVNRQLPMIHIYQTNCKSTSGNCNKCTKTVKFPK